MEPSWLTVGAFLADEWLPAIRASVRPSTWASYSMIVRVRIAPRIGGLLLQGLSPAQLNSMSAERLAGGGPAGRPLAARTVRLTHATIRKALADELRWGRVARNVADVADPPSAKVERQSRRDAMRTWSTPELLRLTVGNNRPQRPADVPARP